MGLPVLYSFRRCPYAMRARLALLQAGIAVELREVVLRDKPAAMLAVSPKGTVPVLVTPAGDVIEQSLDIMQWALAQNDPGGWLRAGPAHADPWIGHCDGPFKQALDRYKYAERHPERTAAAYRDDAVHCLAGPLAAALAQHDWLGGTTPNVADAAVFPFVRQFAAVDAAWFDAGDDAAARAPVRRWLDRWAASPLFAEAMVRTAPWSPGVPAQ